MNQDSSFPPMLPPSSELGALLFAVLPCLQETYRPLASFAYHMTELTKIKTIPAIPSFSGLSGIDGLITDKDIMLHSLSFYGKMFRMPLLSTIATLLQGMQFYQAYKDILPGLFSGMGTGNDTASAFGGIGGLSPDLFSMLGGISPDLFSSLFSGFTGKTAPPDNNTSDAPEPAPATNDSVSESSHDPSGSEHTSDAAPPQDTSFDLYDSLYGFLTPEQQQIYENLMHTE